MVLASMAEPGYRREKCYLQRFSKRVGKDKLVLSFDGDTTSHYAILVNGMGATPLMEQFIFTNDVMDLLDDKGVQIRHSRIGNLQVTSIDMAGISLTLLRLSENADWLEGLNADVKTIAWG